MFMALVLGAATATAQNIRYVKTNGDNTKNGLSWENAKKDIQDAINDLVNNNLTGEVWVQGSNAPADPAVYTPTESTESSSSPLYKAFKIPAGITVRGGFAGTETFGPGETVAQVLAKRQTTDNHIMGKGTASGTLDGEPTKGGVYVYKTILSGKLTNKEPDFTWDDVRKQFKTSFYGNSYHVVWFAMNGFTNGRANPLAKPAKLEGCVVEHGNAFNGDLIADHPANAYGGGIYMVANSFVYNCEVRQCEASRDGGGIYMDGGGIVRRTYVHDCQALGVGTEHGYGGGICEDGSLAGNSKRNPIVVAQSAVTNCCGRFGGGMGLKVSKVDDGKYTVVVNTTLVNNNTATTEAGGIYTLQGGGVAACTIVNNQCNGSGIVQNGMQTGRSGGLYCRDNAYVGNTVIWGNECISNNHLQYVSTRSRNSNDLKTKFLYNAVSKVDNTDWSGTTRMGVLSLADVNEDTGHGGSKGFPLFFEPTPSAGYYDAVDDPTSKTTDPLRKFVNWTVSSESFLTHAGIATVDLDYDQETPAPTDNNDMQFNGFNARPTIGAYVGQVVDIAPARNITYDGVTYDYAFFVDPDYINHGDNPGHNGADWTHPARFLGNVLDFIDDHKSHVGAHAPGEYDFTNNSVAIFVKEGTVDNTRTWGSKRIRVGSLEIPSNVSIFGSFSAELENKDVSKRNPVLTPTLISAKTMDRYDFNIAHLININNKENILVDGFKLTFANANSTLLGNDNKNGAAITLTNCAKKNDVEITIHFRNITVSNCYGDKGTVVYADKASADFENCIFHNNTTATLANSGLVYGINNSDLRFNHCNVLRSVGHASYLDATTKNEWKNSMFYGNLDRAQDNTNDCHLLAIPAFEGPGVKSANLTGQRCMFDLVSRPLYDSRDAQYSTKGISGINLGAGIPDNSTYYVRTTGKGQTETERNDVGLSYPYTSGWANGYPRMVNPTKNAGYSMEGDVTYYGRATSFEPHNDNPVVNAATTEGELHSARQWGKDITTVTTRDFGGLPDIGAVESRIATDLEIANENGNPDGQMPYGVAYYVRDYAQPGMPSTYIKTGSNPDTYVEQTDGNKGKGNYVKEGSDYIFLDGASWQYAVSGNAQYLLAAAVEKSMNTVFETKSDGEDDTKYTGKFRIKTSDNKYIYIDGTTPKVTTDRTKANVFEVEGATAPSIQTGTKYIRTTIGNTTYYLYRNNNNASATTQKNSVSIASFGGGYSISANGRPYLAASNNNITTRSGGGTTAWTFEAEHPLRYQEYPYKQDDVTQVTEGRTGTVTQSTAVSEPLNFHVYRNLDDYNNSSTKKTYKIKRKTENYYLKSGGTGGGYLYPNASGDDFILLQDGEYGKYYIYDVTTSKYIYYQALSWGAASVVRLGATKGAWWIDKSETVGALNIVYGEQPWTTTGNWSMTCATNTSTVVSVAAKTNDNAQLVLVANQDYDVYNYQVEGKAAEYVNGLQYAVNTVNEEFQKTQVLREVHVARGTYTNRTGGSGSDAQAEKDKNIVSQPYAYEMKEGVNVLGGYPCVGNPGEEQRQPKMYETILQPSASNPAVDMTFPSNPGSTGYTQMNVTRWSTCVTKADKTEPGSVGRVLVQKTDFSTNTMWDGFTLQNGFLHAAYMENIGPALSALTPANVKIAGGAGVLLQGNGNLVNCEIKNNVILCDPNGDNIIKGGKDVNNVTNNTDKLYTFHMGGAGIFMTQGTKSTVVVENCIIEGNQIITKAYKRNANDPDNIWMYGAGLFQDGGNVYNTISHDNKAVTINPNNITGFDTSTQPNNEMILGTGAFVARGNFYNNTIVNNMSTSYFQGHNNHCTFAGIHVFDAARIYNSIIADNESHWSYEGWSSGTSPGHGVPVSAFADGASGRTSRDPSKVHVVYSFVDVNVGETNGTGDQKAAVDLVSQNDTEFTNVYFNRVQGTSTTTTALTTKEQKKAFTRTVYNQTGSAAELYHLVEHSPAINAGLSPIPGVTIPDVDADYTDRIKDCRIDMGAYESDGVSDIHPQEIGQQAFYYVTPDGYGTTNASDPENAACAEKLQRVIDAAGRYKLLNPTKQVIVKVANSYDLLHSAVDPTDFTYYATRTTDQTSTDTRMWSTMIPRGVEVWGGYTDRYIDAAGARQATWTNANNGFNREAVQADVDAGKAKNVGDKLDCRNITKNATYFDSYFYNKDMGINATTYHVVTFTERVYDTDGKPYLAADYDKSGNTLAASSTYDGTQRDESLFLHMSDVIAKTDVITVNEKKVSNRAVLDGIFVTGGNADGKAIAGSTNLNANGYGGAAIVTDYAYVRNCIVMENSATNGGGLALTNNALVSGSLIIQNSANSMGGGLYIFEDGSVLSNGIRVNTQQGSGPTMDANMSHVLTSTIVNNQAQQGGGVWFSSKDPNTRLNSVAIWQNFADDQANVSGDINPEQLEGDQRSSTEFFPFAYSAIQDLAAAGSNNQTVNPVNKYGVRFVKTAYDVNIAATPDLNKMAEEDDGADNKIVKYVDFGYYGLSNYSILRGAGMPIGYYNQLKDAIAIADDDFMGTDRLVDSQRTRKFVEIGARALNKALPRVLMLRLFVANPNDVNTDHMETMIGLGTKNTPTEAETYYSTQGSTFAHPMNSIQDALDYIKLMRTDADLLNNYHANNLPFEILVGKGIWNPTVDLNGGTENVLGTTFAIPEGVSIYGGFDPKGGGQTYYGRHNAPNIGENSPQNMSDGKLIESTINAAYTEDYQIGANDDPNKLVIQQWDINNICTRRAMNDNNANGIIEPWEFKNQTIFSGELEGGENRGVYHVITVVADQNVVGNLPKASKVHSNIVEENPGVGQTLCDGYHAHMEGQQVRLNGIIVTGGNSFNCVDGAVDEYGSYTYYQGGGLFADGNRYNDNYNHPSLDPLHPDPYHVDGTAYESKHKKIYGVGYRDIPVSVVNCQFRNNKAGYGGAISTNTTLEVFASSFEQNLAEANSENATYTDAGGTKHNATVMYPGEGGAIHCTNQLKAFNTLFANNEARSAGLEIAPVKHPTFRVPQGDPGLFGVLRGCGGAIHAGLAAKIHIVNCDLVKNMANMYPAIYTMNPTKDLSNQDDLAGGTHYVMSPDYNQLVNTVAWQNEVNPDMLAKYSGNSIFKFASKLMINVGPKERTGYYGEDDQNFDAEHTPASQADLDGVRDAHGENDSKWQESAWFCAYEKGAGFTPHNERDFREIDYKPFIFAPNQVRQHAKSVMGEANYVYQNCNIEIASENAVLEGPNFVNPSKKAGVEGFMESADWSPARINNLTDNGSGMVKQTIDANYNCSFDKYTSAPARSIHAGGGAPISYTQYTDEVAGDYDNLGAYTVTAYAANFPEYKHYMSVGADKYMASAKAGDTENVTIGGVPVTRQRNLPRISYDPNPSHGQTYIDIGVYEYQHAKLGSVNGSEVDLLWVSTKEKPENGIADGTTWETPTSDLQRAIETLLASRNGHRKEIRIMDGEYTPYYSFTQGDGTKTMSYYINTLDLNKNTILPLDGSHNKVLYQGVKSLTIKGGYSKDLKNMYDTEAYKVIIRQQESASANTDHLFYIADATQRYGYDDLDSDANKHYSADNNWGAWPNVGAKTTKTLPIYIDGLTLVNDKATTTSGKGAAIYYADYATDDKHRDTPASTTDADVTKTLDSEGVPNAVLHVENTPKVTLSKSHIIASGKVADKTGSAVYFGTGGGEALVYNVVFHSNPGMPLQSKVKATTVNNTFALNGNLLDLTVADSKILNSVLWRNNPTNGTSDATATAWGNQCHVNSSVPAVSATAFAYNTYTGGLYKDDTNYAVGGNIAKNLYNVGLDSDNGNIALGPNFKNPYLEANTTEQYMLRSFDLNPSLRILNRGNDALYKNNVEAQAAPNQGKLATTTNILDLSAVNTTDKDAMGRQRVQPTCIDLGAIEYQYNLDRILFVDPNKSAAEGSSGLDWNTPLGYGSLQDAIDLVGIYHANNPKEEAYVFVKGASSTNEGLDLKETITMRDGVSVYGGIPSDFIQGIDKVAGKYPDANIENYIRTAKEKREGPASPLSSKTTVNGIKIPAGSTFSNYDTSYEEGGETKHYYTTALVDGFVVTAGTTSEPVVDLRTSNANAAIVVRNTIVAGNDLRGAGVNAVEVGNGLIYEVLMRDNKVDANKAVLNVGEHGYVVSATVEGKTNVYNEHGVGDISTLSEHDGHVFNSIINCIEPTGNALGSDRAFVNNKEISGYFYNMHDANLNYQLTETSDYIDDATITDYNCTVDHSVSPGSEQKCHNPKHFLPTNLRPFVNYMTDRDLLGVPRVLAGISNHWSLDRGAFETWKVEQNFHTGKLGTISTIKNSSGKYIYKNPNDRTLDSSDLDVAAIATKFYPHYGNVVYVMEGKFATADAPGAGYDDTNSYPGLILLKDGASFYANGRALTCPYVIVERKVKKDGSVVALPYDMNYITGVSRPYYNAQNKLDEQRTGITNGVYTYNGIKRSDWRHIFHNVGNGNDCWTSLTGSQTVEACKGVFYSAVENIFNENDHHTAGTQPEVTLRFAAKGAAINDYVYTENPTSGVYVQKKTVALTKYDDDESTNHGADFTDEKDMGWNLIGLPWLVSSYKPYEKTTAGDANHGVSGKYMMHIPHEMWLYFDGMSAPDGTTTKPGVMGDGGYYRVNSWESSDATTDAELIDHIHTNPWHVSALAQQAIWVGEGFFMQTATLDDTETLTFYRPLAPAMDGGTDHIKIGRFYFDGEMTPDGAKEVPAEDGVALVATEYYTADGMHLHTGEELNSNNLPVMRRGSVIIIVRHYSNGTKKIEKRRF